MSMPQGQRKARPLGARAADLVRERAPAAHTLQRVLLQAHELTRSINPETQSLETGLATRKGK
jgi:hypothetical protein